jgi:chemotaxis response regulator CheB
LVPEIEESVKFPKRLRHNGRGKVRATIYKRPAHPQFRLYWRTKVDGAPPVIDYTPPVDYFFRQVARTWIQ